MRMSPSQIPVAAGFSLRWLRNSRTLKGAATKHFQSS